MKYLVNCLQYCLVLLIIYPVYYTWQTDKVSDFCHQIEGGMTKEKLLELGYLADVNMKGPNYIKFEGGRWHAFVVPGRFVSGSECVIKGAGRKVATVDLFKR